MRDTQNLIENRKEDPLTSMMKKIDMKKNMKDTITKRKDPIEGAEAEIKVFISISLTEKTDMNMNKAEDKALVMIEISLEI